MYLAVATSATTTRRQDPLFVLMLSFSSATPKGEFTPGLEFSGVVTKVGGSGGGLAVGERVMGACRFGGYATDINIDERYLRRLPDDWSFQECVL